LTRFHFPFNGKRFIGDNRLKIFHDCVYEAPFPRMNSCRIDYIPAEEVRTFEPDKSSEAWRRGFVQCPYCRHEEKELIR
jgi:hypothetical protein